MSASSEPRVVGAGRFGVVVLNGEIVCRINPPGHGVRFACSACGRGEDPHCSHLQQALEARKDHHHG